MPFVYHLRSTSPDLRRRISVRRVQPDEIECYTADASSPSVLVVEDHEDTRELYMTCLSLKASTSGGAPTAPRVAQVASTGPTWSCSISRCRA